MLKKLEQEFPEQLKKLMVKLEKAEAVASDLKDRVTRDERLR